LNIEKGKLMKMLKCEKCGRPFKISNGRWGKFLACTGYPECKNIKKILDRELSKDITDDLTSSGIK